MGGAGERTLAAQLAEPTAPAAGRAQAHDDPTPEPGAVVPSAKRLQFGEAFMWAPHGAGVARKPPTEDRAPTRSFSFLR
jgi:hypothetical protein